MYKTFVYMCVVFTLTEAFPWQFLPPVPGFVPVYIRNGDTPLADINLDLAEAFHEIPIGRSSIQKDISAQDDDDVEKKVPQVPASVQAKNGSKLTKPSTTETKKPKHDETPKKTIGKKYNPNKLPHHIQKINSPSKKEIE